MLSLLLVRVATLPESLRNFEKKLELLICLVVEFRFDTKNLKFK